MNDLIVEPVDLGDRSYDVYVGPGALRALPDVLPPVERVAIVTQPEIPVEVDPGVEHRVFTIGQGEAAKSLDTVGELCAAFAQWGLTRGDCVVGVGGGLVTDVAGFAAAVYHRGVPVVQVPTQFLPPGPARISTGFPSPILPDRPENVTSGSLPDS